ncbi:hypothetical protein T02_15020 [Trichinella nativa]|uniref:Uncharacterized protein n=1 Tax=Trichinella nativa TaxID=6335 RepID=A0A0V1LJF2_9BILA|nr:hypothetical protein T02_15020 [Trichinella nativa]
MANLFYELLVFNSYPLLKLYQKMRQIKMSVHVTTAIILKITINSRRINGLFGVSKIEIE